MQNELVSFDGFGMSEINDAALLSAVAGGGLIPTVSINASCQQTGRSSDINVNTLCIQDNNNVAETVVLA